MVLVVSHAPVAAERLAGFDTAVYLLVATGVTLLAIGLALRRLLAAGERRERDHTDRMLGSASRETGERPAWRAGRDADAPQHPGSERVTPGPPNVTAPPTTAFHAEYTASAQQLGSISAFALTLDRSRRLAAAEERVARTLAELPEGCWIVERYVLVGAHRIPFLVVGAGGVFALCATDGAWTMHDLDVLSRLGADLRDQLPGYHGTVHAGVCLAYDEMAPRSWHGGAELHGRGGWVLGIDWLQPWLYGHDPEHGIGVEDLRRLDKAAGPWWNRRITARLPARHNAG